jgi:hypothetical protein
MLCALVTWWLKKSISQLPGNLFDTPPFRCLAWAEMVADNLSLESRFVFRHCELTGRSRPLPFTIELNKEGRKQGTVFPDFMLSLSKQKPTCGGSASPLPTPHLTNPSRPHPVILIVILDVRC